MKSSFSTRAGFTIVELIIVVVVIAILAAVAVVGYGGIQASARDRAVLSDLNSIETEVARYATKNGGSYSAALQWYSASGTNSNIDFIPTSGSVVDVVTNGTDFCIRVFNPRSATYKTLQTAATTGSSNSACTAQPPSLIAQEDNVNFGSVSWTQVTSAGVRNWNGVTSSSSGQYLAATAQSGYIYTSSDGGINWIERTTSGSRLWMSIDSSSDGSKIVASTRSYLFLSTDYGAIWTQLTAAGNRDWRGITMSADGTKIATLVATGYIYTSSNMGGTWVERTAPGSRNWQSMSSSADGTKLLATNINSGNPYVSQDSGVTWSPVTTFTNHYNYQSAMSADGSTLAITRNTGTPGIYTSTDMGATWTNRGGGIAGNGWMDVALSQDGSKVVASKGNVYTSLDTGATFTLNSTIPLNSQNYDVDMSGSGAKLIVGGWAGYLYVGNYQ